MRSRGGVGEPDGDVRHPAVLPVVRRHGHGPLLGALPGVLAALRRAQRRHELLQGLAVNPGLQVVQRVPEQVRRTAVLLQAVVVPGALLGVRLERLQLGQVGDLGLRGCGVVDGELRGEDGQIVDAGGVAAARVVPGALLGVRLQLGRPDRSWMPWCVSYGGPGRILLDRSMDLCTHHVRT